MSVNNIKKHALIIILILVTALSVTACGKKKSEKPATLPGVIVPGTYTVDTSKNYLLPDNSSNSSEDKELLDKYYKEMQQRYPSFARIPRERFKETVYRNGEFTHVSFNFCFGGMTTDCYARFSIGPDYPEGQWKLEENEFKEYYQWGIDDSIVTKIKEYFADNISEYIDKNSLEYLDVSEELKYMYWTISDGKIYASIECITNVTDRTIEEYGCGSHAHIVGQVEMEVKDNKITLTFLPVSAS